MARTAPVAAVAAALKAIVVRALEAHAVITADVVVVVKAKAKAKAKPRAKLAISTTEIRGTRRPEV